MLCSAAVFQEGSHLSIPVETDKLAVEIELARKRLIQPDMRNITRKPLIILGFIEAPIQPRRRDFQNILVRDEILHIKNQTNAFAHCGAIVGSHTTCFVDENAQELRSPANQLRMNELDTLT